MAEECVECPRCHRLDFEFAANRFCQECHWVIRPEPVAHPYGFDVLLEVRSANGMRTEMMERHFKGSEATARRRARAVKGFARVLAVVPLSEAVWLSAYGEGRM